MNELHLFAGIGGGILGGILNGHTCVCAVENNRHCQKELLQRQRDGILPRFPIWDDITTFDGTEWRGNVDVVCGGFPCQDISAAGRGGGITGSRSGLWAEMARIVGEVQSAYVFVENSPKLTSRGLGVVLGDLAALGYDARWGVLGAHHAGAPHKRDRMWILAYREREGLERHAGNGEHGNQPGRDGKETGRSVSTGRISWWDTDPAELPDADKFDDDRGGHGTGQICRRQEQADISTGETEMGDTEKHTERAGLCQKKPAQNSQQRWGRSANASGDVSDAENERILRRKRSEKHDRQQSEPEQRGETQHECGQWWPAESGVGRVADGVPDRVERLKALGNAQVPAVAALAWDVLINEMEDE